MFRRVIGLLTGRPVCAGLLLMAGIGTSTANFRPTVGITNPPSNALLHEGDSIDVGAGASDYDGTVAFVEFYLDDTLLGTAVSPPYRVPWLNVVLGTHTLKAVAEDNAQERSTSSVVTVTVNLSNPGVLAWAAPNAPGYDWNESAFNWRNGYLAALFHEGDAVEFRSASRVFIGIAGAPGAVAPSRITVSADTVFEGGDILTGSMTSSARLVFSNYSGSLSFPGGTTISPSQGSVTYDVSRAPDGATVHFGTGPVAIQDTTFIFVVQANRTATLENDFSMRGNCWVPLGDFAYSDTVARFAGTLNLGGRFMAAIRNGTNQFSPWEPADTRSHEWAGPIVLSQTRTLTLTVSASGGYRSKGLLLSGRISDGPGPATNQLRLGNYAVPFVRLTAMNTYSNGTVIENSPSVPQGLIEVGPDASLGVGDVEVTPSGVLRLMGSQNIASNRTLTARGRVIVEPGVRLRLSTLKLGTNTFTSGLFTATNGLGYLVSNGTCRLPATNLPPTVALTEPLNGALLLPSQPLVLRATAADVDSYLQRVEFLVNDRVAGVLTNRPFHLTLLNPVGGVHSLQAIAYDDDGGVQTSAPVHVTVAPVIESIELPSLSEAVIKFAAPLNSSCTLEMAETLPTPAWTPLATIPPEPTLRWMRITNALPANATARFYRLRL